MAVAEQVGGVIINADSAQVYADLRVVSARPSEAEEAALPHRLFGYIDGAEACDAVRWADDVKAALAEEIPASRIPILVGGTGLYQRTLLYGIAPIPKIDPAIRSEIRALPVAEAMRQLVIEDPVAAQRLETTDTVRVARALEVIRSTGAPIGEWQKQRIGGIIDEIELVPLILLPDRKWLYARCDQRFEAMFDGGAVSEIEALVARKLPPELPAMRAIGVAEIVDFLASKISRNDAIAAAKQATRRYAKRQYTWFSHQLPDSWPRGSELDSDTLTDELAIKLRL